MRGGVEVEGEEEPRAAAHEAAAAQPLGAVVPVWRAGVWGGIVVAIRATRFCSDIDRDLRRCRARNAQQSRNQDRKDKKFQISHKFLLALERSNPDAKVVMTGRD